MNSGCHWTKPAIIANTAPKYREVLSEMELAKYAHSTQG